MRRADPSVFTPLEREDVVQMLSVLVQVKEAICSFEDGEIDLRTAVRQIVVAVSGRS